MLKGTRPCILRLLQHVWRHSYWMVYMLVTAVDISNSLLLTFQTLCSWWHHLIFFVRNRPQHSASAFLKALRKKHLEPYWGALMQTLFNQVSCHPLYFSIKVPVCSRVFLHVLVRERLGLPMHLQMDSAMVSGHLIGLRHTNLVNEWGMMTSEACTPFVVWKFWCVTSVTITVCKFWLNRKPWKPYLLLRGTTSLTWTMLWAFLLGTTYHSRAPGLTSLLVYSLVPLHMDFLLLGR